MQQISNKFEKYNIIKIKGKNFFAEVVNATTREVETKQGIFFADDCELIAVNFEDFINKSVRMINVEQ